ncbi:hypothetical protein I4U23_012645 [Adineta vaga]|nr:hypothetical protein I4U23_012645 [Adineta vaga]
MANIKSSGTTTTQQVSVVSTEVHRHLQFNVQNAQDVLLVWLDSKISNNNEDCQNTFSHLQCAVSDVKAYTDSIDCIQYIETINDRIVFMLVSDSLGQHVIPRIHNLSQVDSIFIFDGNNSRQEEWMKEWSKIKGIFTEIMSVCGTLRQGCTTI